LSARHLNQLVDRARDHIIAEPPLWAKQDGNVIYIGADVGANWWVGEIDSTGQVDLSDGHYYVKRQMLASSDEQIQGSDFADDTFPKAYSDAVVVANLPELSDGTHWLREGQEVIVFEVPDNASPPNTRYVMSEHPWYCQRSDYDPHDTDEGKVLPKASDATGDPGDSDHWYVRGHMYESDGVINPWFTINMPLCETASDAIVATDATGSYAVASDFVLYGHMYRDSDNNLNPVVAMNPGGFLCIEGSYDPLSALPDGVDITGSGSGQGVFWATGFMYKDATDKWNPWVILDGAKMFCIHGIYADPVSTPPASKNITGNPGSSSDYWVSGHMYQDSNDVFNPWISINLRKAVSDLMTDSDWVASDYFCVDSDYRADLSDLDVLDITNLQDNWDSSDYIIKGHMYRDSNGRWNPWMKFNPDQITPSTQEGTDIWVCKWVKITQLGTVTLDATYDWRGRVIWTGLSSYSGVVSDANADPWSYYGLSQGVAGISSGTNDTIFLASGVHGGVGGTDIRITVDGTDSGALKLTASGNFVGEFQVCVWAKATGTKNTNDLTI